MKKASMILGIVGGSLAILTAIALILVSLFVGAVSTKSGYTIDEDDIKDYVVWDKDFDKDDMMDKDFDKYEDCPYEDEESCPVAAKFDKCGGKWGKDGMWKEADDKKIFVSKSFGPHDFDRYNSMAPRFAIGLLWFLAAASLIGGVLGIVGGSIAKRKNTAGGVLMIVGALLASNVFAILLTGGILALVSGKKKPEDETEESAQ